MPSEQTFKNTVGGTIVVALVLSLVCALIVSAAAVGLRPRIQQNKQLKVQRNVLMAAGRWEEGFTAEDIEREFEAIERVLVNLPRMGEDGPEAGTINTTLPDDYDARKAAGNPQMNVNIPPDLDLANIRRREKIAPAFLVRGEGGQIEKVVLPAYGKGLWSTLYGFIALESDFQTVSGITFYEHAETPGLGGEIDNEQWKAKWKGKVAIDPNGNPQIDVIKGSVTEETPGANYKIDGLSGATITSNGVEGLVNYWLGPDAFGPFLSRLRSGTVQLPR